MLETMTPEYTLVEKPAIDILQGMGYAYLPPSQNAAARDGLNHVLLRDEVIAALQRLNGLDAATARAVYQDLLAVSDNARWTAILRGQYSRRVPGQRTQKTIRLIDFADAGNNRFTVANQFRVKSQSPRKPDIVCFVNGIPLVVIEAKSPADVNKKIGEAFEQIKAYERDIPRLFYSNAFSIITDGGALLYGATGAASDHWGRWRDPWPKQDGDFAGELHKGLYCLLNPSRLLDLLAHFIVFETRDGVTVKKICRYQQFRAVNKLAARVAAFPLSSQASGAGSTVKKGLIWHTQGSGKSLTMVFAALKLKMHLMAGGAPVSRPAGDLAATGSPNILVLTDRIDLDEQISATFAACGLPNPIAADRVHPPGRATCPLFPTKTPY